MYTSYIHTYIHTYIHVLSRFEHFTLETIASHFILVLFVLLLINALDCGFPVSANVNGAILTLFSEMEALKSLLEDIGVRLADYEEGKRRLDIHVNEVLAKYTKLEGAAGTSKGTKSVGYRVHDGIMKCNLIRRFTIIVRR